MMGNKVEILWVTAAIALLIVTGVSAEKISFSPISSQISAGSTSEIAAVLAEAPGGLAGYEISVMLKNQGIGEIVNVSYPSWVLLSNHSGLPSNSITLKGVDLQNKVVPGARDIVLFTLSVKGNTVGESGVSSIVITMQKEDGTSIQADEALGTIVVTSTTTSPQPVQPGSSGSGGGGGGSGLSMSAAPGISDQAARIPGAGSSAEANVTTPAETPPPTTSALTQAASSPVAGTERTPTQVFTTPQGNVSGYFTITGLIGGILVIVGIVLIILLVMNKKRN